MNNIRDIRRRLRSVAKNQHIMRAMKMVASVQMRRAQEQLARSRMYAEKFKSVFAVWMEQDAVRNALHSCLRAGLPKRRLYLLIATDRGLCGALNSNLFRYVQKTLADERGGASERSLIVTGNKACVFFKRKQSLPDDVRLQQAYPLAEAQAENLGRQFWELFRAGRADCIDVFYASSRSVLRQTPGCVRVLPLPPESAAEQTLDKSKNIVFEPAPEKLVEDMMLRYLTVQLRMFFWEAQLSEHSARMVMMDQAGKNADAMARDLQLTINKARQVLITRELADITTGVEAMS